MTLIVGLNLSDRLYLAADTRLTRTLNDAKSYIDDILKVADLTVSWSTGNSVAMAVAGDLHFSAHMYYLVSQALEKGLLSEDIRILLTQIEVFTKDSVHKWMCNGNSCPESCIIFSWMCRSRRKEIDLDKLNSLRDLFGKGVASQEELEKVKNQLLGNSVFKMLAEKIPMKNLMSFCDEPWKIEINAILQAAIDNNQNLIEAPDSLLFGVKVTSNGIDIEVAEWWEFLIFWSQGMSKNNASESFLARLELQPGKNVTQSDLMETGEIRQEIRSIAKKHELLWVGWGITTAVIRNNGFKTLYEYQSSNLIEWVLIEGVFRHGDQFLVVKNGKEVVLTDFYRYSLNSSTKNLSL